MVSKARIRATNRYIKTHMRRFVIQCNNDRDADVIAYLEETGNYNAEVKRLVREEIIRRRPKEG